MNNYDSSYAVQFGLLRSLTGCVDEAGLDKAVLDGYLGQHGADTFTQPSCRTKLDINLTAGIGSRTL